MYLQKKKYMFSFTPHWYAMLLMNKDALTIFNDLDEAYGFNDILGCQITIIAAKKSKIK